MAWNSIESYGIMEQCEIIQLSGTKPMTSSIQFKRILNSPRADQQFSQQIWAMTSGPQCKYQCKNCLMCESSTDLTLLEAPTTILRHTLEFWAWLLYWPSSRKDRANPDVYSPRDRFLKDHSVSFAWAGWDVFRWLRAVRLLVTALETDIGSAQHILPQASNKIWCKQIAEQLWRQCPYSRSLQTPCEPSLELRSHTSSPCPGTMLCLFGNRKIQTTHGSWMNFHCDRPGVLGDGATTLERPYSISCIHVTLMPMPWFSSSTVQLTQNRTHS